VAEAMLQDILEAYREVQFDVEDIKEGIEEPGPFENVLIQEVSKTTHSGSHCFEHV
jgi:hypothetical protein